MSGWQLVAARETYYVSESGDIGRPLIGMKPSGQWKVTGAVRRNNFGRTVERVAFPACMNLKDWRHKNGAARWHLCDLDHGTHRQWGEKVLRIHPVKESV